MELLGYFATLYLCHDYPSGDDKPVCWTSVGEQKKHNIMLGADTSEEDFIVKRTLRDRSFSAPKILFPSIQTNIRIGDFGQKSEITGFRYLKIPVGMFD